MPSISLRSSTGMRTLRKGVCPTRRRLWRDRRDPAAACRWPRGTLRAWDLALALEALHQNEVHGDLPCANSAGATGSASPRSSCTTAHRFADPTSTSVAPAIRWLCESFPGRSMSKLWCACLTVDTFSPRATMRGMTLARRVVLPEPLQPARPMMRMRHYSRVPAHGEGRGWHTGLAIRRGEACLAPFSACAAADAGRRSASPLRRFANIRHVDCVGASRSLGRWSDGRRTYENASQQDDEAQAPQASDDWSRFLHCRPPKATRPMNP